MASYQDIDIRLKVIEDKVAYIMKSITQVIPPAVAGGKPIMRSLLDAYLEHQSIERINQPFSGKRDVVPEKSPE